LFTLDYLNTMPTGNSHVDYPIKVRSTEIVATDSPRQYREKLARIALDEMYQFVAVLDARGTLLEVNRAALEGGGLTLKDVEGKPFWECFWWGVSADIMEALRKAIARVAKGEFIRYDVEVYGRAGGKETIIIDFSMIPVKDDKGKVVFIVPEGRDITEKKAFEQQVAQKNADLQALLERIRELDEIKTQFFANVSHELRTPLALILGPAERLLDTDRRMTPELQHDTAQVIARNARMLLKHVNDLLDISKLEAKKLKIELKETDVAALIHFVASHFELLANERQVNFCIETGPSCISAVDPEKLQRVVMNLLSNAFKFVPNGGTVRFRLDTSEKELILMVEDSGPGVQPEMRHLIFERFRQGDGATNRQFAGTGLGLAIAHEFVAMHKGTIAVRDSDLGGALFLVKLPAISLPSSGGAVHSQELKLNHGILDGLLEELRQPGPVVPPKPGLAAAVNKETVLVVEDNPEMNEFISQSLRSEYHVISAFDGQEGLEKALLFQPSLIVSDIMMPKVSGVEMITQLRKRPEMLETPILLLSAKADEELKLSLLEESAQDFITKPFSERDLQVRVRNLITVRRSNEVLRMAEITKRERVEAINRDLLSQSRFLSKLFEQAPGFMAVVRGPNYVFELANEAYYKLVGHRDIMGKPLIEALPEIRDQQFIEILDGVFSTGKAHSGTGVPVLLQRGTGAREQRYVNFIYQPLFAEKGAVEGVFVEGHDVTEQILAEEKSAKLAAIVESSYDAIISKSLDGIITSWNNAAERMYGYTPDEIIGQSVLKLIPEERHDEEPVILSRLRKGERVENFETQRITKDNRLVDISLTISPVKDSRGNIIGISKIARDIGDKKKEEQRKNDFIAMVSHELRTPLTSIKAYVQVLLRIAKKENNSFSINALSKTEAQIKKMVSMIGDFLSLTKLGEGKIKLNKEIFDLQPLVEEAISDAQFLTSTHLIKLTDCHFKVHADKDKIGQVLNNLLTNAIKYSPGGGKILIGCEKDNNKVKVSVADEGIGISADNQRKLFDRFYRVENEQMRTVSGFGVGLYLVSEILRYHDSEIEVESKEGVGSTFYFTLALEH
jgi:PAS domain S-box-containing protein